MKQKIISYLKGKEQVFDKNENDINILFFLTLSVSGNASNFDIEFDNKD